MDYSEQVKSAKGFSQAWANRGNEKSDTQSFWLSLLRDVFNVEHPEEYIQFEKRVKIDGNTKFIDAYIPHTLVLIEQKDLGKDLRKEILQSDKTNLTPYQQAKRYSDNLKRSEKPNWIITCNFKEFYVYDMERPNNDPTHILLEDLSKNIHLFHFLISETNQQLKLETELSVKAGELVGIIYNKFYDAYKTSSLDDETIHSNLNKLCVRLVFCLYAEDSGIFGKKNQFHDYLLRFEPRDMRRALIDLFRILNTPEDQRDPFVDEELVAFPYTNGGLFEEEIIIPQITNEIKDMLLENASDDFDWSDISPTIFGATFESTLNPETRRSGGMHYTSIENIHKVIDPLFLNDLKDELKKIKKLKQLNAIEKRVSAFQNKLANLKFLDPACGSGNFLTETYLSLRKLENEALDFMRRGQADILVIDQNYSPIKVSISQFYGIEINDFAVSVGKTALWIAESQMMKETSDILGVNLDYLPLKTNANIIEANALRMDWNDYIPMKEINFIMGNPPFLGQSYRTTEQSNDMSNIFGKGAIETKLDYVICWYKKSIEYMQNTNIWASFVSTNSICQGESVPTFWRLMDNNGVEIQFAYRTFVWDSEAISKASVHCVIIGFTAYSTGLIKRIFDNNKIIETKHINGYLYPSSDIWLENRSNKPKKNMSKMTTGSPPTDDGALTMTIKEKDELIKKYPCLIDYIKPFIGAKEFLHDPVGKYSRYCLWFADSIPSNIVQMKELKERFERVKNLRLKSKADRIIKMAKHPYLFCQNRQPQSTYLVIPRHSSENRKYIPIGFMEPNIIAGDACSIIPNASLELFGILISNVHMDWVKVVCGRLKSDYRYSPSTYNNFPFPLITESQKKKIQNSAQGILDARKKYSKYSLSDMYGDQMYLFPELEKAHENNDKVVKDVYGFNPSLTEDEIVAELFKMYQQLTEAEKS